MGSVRLDHVLDPVLLEAVCNPSFEPNEPVTYSLGTIAVHVISIVLSILTPIEWRAGKIP